MIKALSLLTLVCTCTVAAAADPIDRVRVSKAKRTLELLSKGKVVKKFEISLGENPVGHKQEEGDERTPEGIYTLDYRNPNSQYYKSIHISYPNQADRQRAAKAGRKPGGDIMIHGLPNGRQIPAAMVHLYDWTNGCIALTNEDMEVVWQQVKNGTKIEILP